MSQIRTARFFCITTAATLLLAALWYALYIFNVIAPPAPLYEEAVSRVENLQVFFAHQRVVAPHELGFTLVAALAFLFIAPLGMILMEIFNHEAPIATAAGAFFVIASGLLVAGQVVQIGTQRAILGASELHNIDTLDSIWDTGLMISNWLENGGYFSLALGMIGWGMVGRRLIPASRGWVMLAGALAITLFTVVICQALEIWTIYDIALSLSGAVLAPIWFVLTANVLNKRGDV